MANSAEAIAFNAGMRAAEVLWDALVIAQDIDTELLLVPSQEWPGIASESLVYPTDTNLQERVGLKIIKATNDASLKYRLQGVDLNGWPLFFRVTNAAGEVDEA